MNQIEKASDKTMDSIGEMITVTLDIKAKDVYGNIMYNDAICSYFTH